MGKKRDSKKIVIVIVISVLAICFIIYNYFNQNSGLDKYKINRHKSVVYDVYSKENTHVPTINLKNNNISIINDQIIDKANSFLMINSSNTISYEFDISGEILSLAILYIDNSDTDPSFDYDVYNINLYKSKVYTREEMLKLYEVDENEITPIVESKFMEFYQNLLGKYFDEECNYDCFLYMRGIKNNNYMDNTDYYIKEGNLYVVKPFNIYSAFSEEKYFKTKDFFIQVTQ